MDLELTKRPRDFHTDKVTPTANPPAELIQLVSMKMNASHIESDQEISKMAQSSSTPKTPVSAPCSPSPDSTGDFENFLDVVNSRVTRLICEGVECLQSADGPSDAISSRTSLQSPVFGASVTHGGVPVTSQTSETSSSSGGLQLSDSKLNLLQAFCPSSMRDANQSVVDSSHDTHAMADLYTSASTLASSIQASSSGSLATPESSSDSGSWASGERSWPFDRVVRLLQDLLGGYWDRSPPGSPSHAPSLTSAETASSSASSCSDGSDALLIDHLPRLPLDSDDELILDSDDEPSIADSDDLAS